MGKKREHRKWNNFSQRGGRQPVVVPQRQLVPVGHAFKPVSTKKKGIIDYPVDWLRKIKPTLYPSRQAQLSTEHTVQGILQLGQFILENAQLTHQMFEQVLHATRNTTEPLTKLSIVKTILDNADGQLLIQALEGQLQLQFIALANNTLFTPDIFLAFIDKVLTKQTALEELYLIQEVGSLGNEVLKRLGGFLVHHPTLKKLGIIDKNLDGNGLNELLNGLKSNSVLEVLNLSECSGLNDGLQQLGALLKQKNCKIRELYLNNTEASNNTIKAIAEALQVNQVLEKLALRYNNFDDHAAETLCCVLPENTQLRDLDLRYNHLSVKTSEQFIEHMQGVLQGDFRYLTGDRTATILRRMPRVLLFNPNSPAPTRNAGTEELASIAESCVNTYNIEIEPNISQLNPGSPITYLFYDLETSGLNLAFDQITQFSAIKTDENFREIARYEFWVKLNPDTVPHPAAFRTHAVSPYVLQEKGKPENEVILKIYDLFQIHTTNIQLGYNTIHFDSKMLRFSFYRNLLPAYEFDQRQQDIYPVVVMFYLLRNTSLACQNIRWPEDGSLKLADIVASNPIQHYTRNAHDALNDVKDTIDVAAMLSSRRDVFDLLMQQFNVDKLIRRLGKLYTRAIEQRTGILLKGQQLGHCFLLFYNGKDYKSKQLNELKLSSEESIWIDLSQVNLEEIITEPSLIHRVLLRRKKTTQNFLFIVDDEENKDNEIYVAINTLLSADQQKLFEANLRLLTQTEFLQTLTQEVTHTLKRTTQTNAKDIDADLYSNFKNTYWPNKGNETVLEDYVKATDVEERLRALDGLCYRLNIPNKVEKVARLIGRNYPEHLTSNQRQIFNDYMERIICSQTKDIVDYKGTPKYTIEESLKRIDEEIKINKSKMSRKDKAFFDELRRYVKEKFLDKRSSQVLLQQNPITNFELQLDQLKNLVATLDQQDATALQRIQIANAPLQAIFGIFKPVTPEGAKRKEPEAGEQEQNKDKKPRVDEEEVVGEVVNPISSSLQLQ